MITNYCFKKYERLKGKKNIKKIFKKGHTLYFKSLKIIYLKNIYNQKTTKIGILVPKKFIKKAVNRNLIKHRLINAYRINKYLLNKIEITYSIFFIWINKELLNYQKIEQIIKKIFSILEKK